MDYRHEWKHEINQADLLALRQRLRAIARPDSHAVNGSVIIDADKTDKVWISLNGITLHCEDDAAIRVEQADKVFLTLAEDTDITIAGGSIDIWPTDDGINANGNGANSVIRIACGDIWIINPSGRDADGLDSNGSIYIEGGRVFISVTGNGGNCALDYGSENGGECVVSGGTVIACGGSAMAEGFDADSPQGFLMYNAAATAGSTISLKDSLGQELLSETIPCPFSSVVISTPELKLGDICTIEIDGVPEQITINNTSSSDFLPAGTFGGGMQHNGRDHGDMSNGRGNRGDQLPADQEPGARPDDMPSLPDNQDTPPLENGQNFSDNSNPFGGWGFPGSMGPTDKMGTFGGEDRPDRQEIRETGGKAFTPEISNFPLSASALILVCLSVLVLLLGLFIAAKIKH